MHVGFVIPKGRCIEGDNLIELVYAKRATAPARAASASTLLPTTVFPAAPVPAEELDLAAFAAFLAAAEEPDMTDPEATFPDAPAVVGPVAPDIGAEVVPEPGEAEEK